MPVANFYYGSESQHRVVDPLVTLDFAAKHGQRKRIGGGCREKCRGIIAEHRAASTWQEINPQFTGDFARVA